MVADRSAIALLSGGLDSGVGLALWLERAGQTVSRCLIFDYGQRSFGAEQQAARRLATRFGLQIEAVELPWLGVAAKQTGSALHVGTPPEGSLEQPGDEVSAAAVWVPARNVVFLAVAAAFAEAAGDVAILTGFNREEAATFPDNSAAFVAAMDAALALGTRAGMTVVAPTIDMDKSDIAAEARRLGLTAADFWSCYGAGPKSCGVCESCLRSLRAWNT